MFTLNLNATFARAVNATWPRARSEGRGKAVGAPPVCLLWRSVLLFNEKPVVVYGTIFHQFRVADTMDMDAHNSFPRWETVMIHEWELQVRRSLGEEKKRGTFPQWREVERACVHSVRWEGTHNLRPIEGTRDVFVYRWEFCPKKGIAFKRIAFVTRLQLAIYSY